MALLVLEDGTVYRGVGFGVEGEAFGEVVFNTSMTGYQEILTDPSYKGQLITMTYPLIGNYGFNDCDKESHKPHASGLIVKELSNEWSNWRSTVSPLEYFKKHNIVGIKDVDTRSLTKHIRNNGSMYGIISTECHDPLILIKKLKVAAADKAEPVKEVSTKEPYFIDGSGKMIAVIDFGIKMNIIRALQQRGCKVQVFPYNTPYKDILALNPDGVLLSNGPGDPSVLTEEIETIKKIIEVKPVFGICLGHQLLCLALGGKTYKLKYGHHGANHPVKDLNSGRVYITSQNHNYAIQNDCPPSMEITHINVNDKTAEGFRHKYLPVMGVQYHPEAAPGPQDSNYIFDDFMKMLEVKAYAKDTGY
jgi:carbamoyl-phosphate synthase small subunit